ncbi:MAG: Crp/Fnr family transcriptional regulator [Candidatus Saccharibacteria bacterium]
MDFSEVAPKMEDFFSDGEVLTRTAGQMFANFETQPDVLLITSGYIKLVTYTTNRQERIQYIAGPGEGIPMHNLFAGITPQPYQLYASAFTDVTYLSKDRQKFLAFIEVEPSVVIAILQGIMQATFDRLYNFNLETSEQRVAHILVLYARKHGTKEDANFTKLDLPMNTHIVANTVYLSKAVTADILEGFRSQGYVEFQGENILVAILRLKAMAGIR